MKQIKIIVVLFTAFLIHLGCDDDHNRKARRSFKEMYPSAEQVDWDVERGYYVADFWMSNAERSAWFNASGDWLMTETDILFGVLPGSVRSAFESSSYDLCRINDVDKIEKSGGAIFYVIEVECDRTEYFLVYTPEGDMTEEIGKTSDGHELYPHDF